MVELPADTPVARPEEMMVAAPGLDDVQFTCPVKSRLEPSLKEPFAVNCCVCPARIEALGGVTDIEFRVAVVTLSEELLDTPANRAVIVVEPFATPVATPAVVALLLMVATPGLEEVHVAKTVRSCVSPLLKVPVALNAVWNPAGTVEL